jgi:hypothetical protein
MGQCDSKPAPKKPASKGPKKELTFGKDPNLNMADFMLSNAKGVTLVKDDLKGQQFLIEDSSVRSQTLARCPRVDVSNCLSIRPSVCLSFAPTHSHSHTHAPFFLSQDCNVTLNDVVAALTCDHLKSCVVSTGPIESSAFLRNCSDCTFVIACCQFRTRECKNCNFFLYTSTEPIIETSTKLMIGCYTMTYFGLAQQFERAKLSVWNNKWSEVFDFTPSEGGGNKTSTNWAPMDMTTETHTKYIKNSDEAAARIDDTATTAASTADITLALTQSPTVPLSFGKAWSSALKPGVSPLLMVFTSDVDMNALLTSYLSFCDNGNSDNNIKLVRSRLLNLHKEWASLLFASERDKALSKKLYQKCLDKSCLALEFVFAEKANAKKEALVEHMRIDLPNPAEDLWFCESKAAEDCAKQLFEYWKEEQ